VKGPLVRLVVAAHLPAPLRPVDPPIQDRASTSEPPKKATAAHSGRLRSRIRCATRLVGAGALRGLGSSNGHVLWRIFWRRAACCHGV